MKILTTGYTGFIGQTAFPYLEGKGCELWHLVRKAIDGPRFIQWDFKSPFPKGLPDFDCIVHLAASVNYSEEFKTEVYSTNTVATMQLADLCNKYDAALIFASTASLHTNAPHVNATTPLSPNNHYEMSKFLAEETIKTVGCRAKILRISGVYGLNGPSHLGLNAAITNALEQRIAPTLHGPGNGLRNYISVIDAAKWIGHETISSAHGDTFKIVYMGAQEVLSIKQYLSTISKELLNDANIIEIEGNDCADAVVEISSPPHPQTSFQDYLRSLISNKQH